MLSKCLFTRKQLHSGAVHVISVLINPWFFGRLFVGVAVDQNMFLINLPIIFFLGLSKTRLLLYEHSHLTG